MLANLLCPLPFIMPFQWPLLEFLRNGTQTGGRTDRRLKAAHYLLQQQVMLYGRCSLTGNQVKA